MKRLIVLVYALALVAVASAGEWHIETVDAEYGTGEYTSLALDSNGYPHISYLDTSYPDSLWYARWDGD